MCAEDTFLPAGWACVVEHALLLREMCSLWFRCFHHCLHTLTCRMGPAQECLNITDKQAADVIQIHDQAVQAMGPLAMKRLGLNQVSCRPCYAAMLLCCYAV